MALILLSPDFIGCDGRGTLGDHGCQVYLRVQTLSQLVTSDHNAICAEARVDDPAFK